MFMKFYLYTSFLTFYVVLSALTAPPKKHVVVVGGGFGGFGAAKALCESGCKVTLIDASDPTGRTPLTTKSGRPFEAGHKGFWRDYPNINDMLSQVGVQEQDVFTRYTNSSFYSPFGLEATAPLWSELPFGELPSPLGQVVASAQLFTRLPIPDRVSLVGLLYAMLDYDRDEETYAKYDRMTAHELFLRMGLSKRLVDDLITPTLLVGLFKPPEDLSAAIVMDLLYFYAFAHQTSFDVRWIKKQSILESIILPLFTKLERDYEFAVLTDTRVEGIRLDANNAVTGLSYSKYENSSIVKGSIEDIDACVLAVGSTGMRNILTGSPQLSKISPELSKAATLGSIACISVRIWLDKIVPTRTPANVFASFDELRGAGGTFFMLDQLQGMESLWKPDDEKKGSVVACDFYNSGALMGLTDEDIISILKDSLLSSAVPAFDGAKIVDSEVRRYPGAVSWFSPGSFKSRPPLQVPQVPNTCPSKLSQLNQRLKNPNFKGTQSRMCR